MTTTAEHRTGMLSPEEVCRFEEQGFLVVNNVLDPRRDLLPIVEDYSALLNRLVHAWIAQGRLIDGHDDLPFEQRVAAVLSGGSIDVARYFDISLPDDVIRPDEPLHLSEPVFRLITHPRLLDVAETIVGSEIFSNPIQHVRVKPPEADIAGQFTQDFLVRRTGWHQDQGVTRPEADGTDTLTVWIPIRDAIPENGCLQVIPGSHRRGLTTHCPGHDGLTIPESLLTGVPVPVPVRAGSVLLLHRRTQHASLPNRSDGVRWSFDLRYQPVGQPTGRDEFPGFIARSATAPQNALSSAEAWADLWIAARRRLASARYRRIKHRWTGDAPPCA